jgi:NAD(P)-dependent dehydrogenase (short-subunit alcohol dehydrogenase family)
MDRTDVREVVTLSLDTAGLASTGGGPIGLPATSLVTGAGRGLGLSRARALAKRGDRVILTDWDAGLARDAASTLALEGLIVDSDRLDVTDASDVEAVVARWDTEYPLTTVVNNAGIAFAKSMADTTADDWDRLMAVNLRGSFLVLKAASTLMSTRATGSIVNVASTSSFTASSSPMVPYDVSKAGIRMMTMAAARELGPSGVRVNAVAPGTMDTQLVRDLMPGSAADDLVSSRIPLGRLGLTNEVANAVAWLSSSEASYVTGHVLVVDGGWLT